MPLRRPIATSKAQQGAPAGQAKSCAFVLPLSFGVSEMLSTVPRLFLVMLAIYFTMEGVSAYLSWTWHPLARATFVAFLAWGIVRGSRIAAYCLGTVMAIFTLAGIVTTYTLVDLSFILLGVFCIGLFASISFYIFFSPALRNLYANKSKVV